MNIWHVKVLTYSQKTRLHFNRYNLTGTKQTSQTLTIVQLKPFTDKITHFIELNYSTGRHQMRRSTFITWTDTDSFTFKDLFPMLLRVKYMISSTGLILSCALYPTITFSSPLGLKLRLQHKCSDLKRSHSDKHLENNHCSVYSLWDKGEEENLFPLTISSGRLNQMTITKTRRRGRWVVGVLVRIRLAKTKHFVLLHAKLQKPLLEFCIFY